MDARELRPERGHNFRQSVARMGVGGRQHQLALIGAAELVGDAADIAGIDQHAIDDAEDFPPRIGQPQQPLAVPDEQLNAQLRLDVLDVLADARLRRGQRGRHLGEVEAPPDGLTDDAQLLEVHW